MAKQKAIKVADASFASGAWHIRSEVLTRLTITAPFDQLLAASLGIKEQIYDGNGSLAEDFEEWGGRQEFYGARLLVQPKQGRLGDAESLNAVQLASLRVDSFSVRRHADSESLRLTFIVTALDESRQIHALVHGIRRDPFDVTIQPAAKDQAESAKNQMALFAKKKAEVDEEADAEGDVVQ